MNKKLTVSIGIPAYNEEENIANTLQSVIFQKQISFQLERVYVVCDGCSDRTVEITKRFSKKYKFVKIYDFKERLGKAERLNMIYKLNSSDFLLTLDGDVILERSIELELMVLEIMKNKNTEVVAGNQIPIPATNFWGNCSRESFFMIYEAAKKYNNGNDIHCLQGSASLLRKEFSKSFRYPIGTITDQGYLYSMAIRNNRKGFMLAHNARIRFKAVDTFLDWRLLGARTILQDKKNLSEYFGAKILRKYKIPRKFILQSIFLRLIKNPIGAIGSIILNIYIRKFPYKTEVRRNGLWDITVSSKSAIKV